MPIEIEDKYVEDPLVIIYPQDGALVTAIHPRGSDTFAGYGIIVCDLVRHIAKAFKVDEDEVWDWVDKERQHPTSAIRAAM